jgi:hypothetical protein
MSGKYGKLVMIGLALIGASVLGNAVLYAFGVSPFNMKEIRESQAIPADGVSRVVIGTDDGDVRVEPGSGDAIVVTVKGRTGRLQKDSIKLKAHERGGEVVIEASREARRRLISFNPGEYELVVELPARQFEQVEIVTVAADISVEHVGANHVMMRTVHGEIETAGLSGSITARTDSGDIELNLRAVDGMIHAETMLGDIEVTTAEAPEKLSLELETRLGEKRVELPGTTIVASAPNVPAVRLAADVGDIVVRTGR